MKMYTTRRTVLKTTAMMLAMFGMPVVANAQWTLSREAEDATMTYAKVSEATAEGNEVSGGKYVEEMSTAKGSSLAFRVNGVPADGIYHLTIDYISMQQRYMLVEVRGYDPIFVDFDQITGSWSGVAGEVENENGEMEQKPGIEHKVVPIFLKKGTNSITLTAFEGDTQEGHMIFAPNIDKISIEQTNEEGTGVKTMNDIEIEAESGQLSGSATKAESDKLAVYPSGDAISLKSSGKATYTVNAPVSGAYAIYIDYTTCQTRWITLKVNSQPKHYLEFNQLTQTWGDMPSEVDETKPLVMKKAVLVYMEAGENTVVLGSYNGPTSQHSDSPNLDKLTIRKVQADVEDPGLETVAYFLDYTDLATKLTCNGAEADATIFDNNENTVWKAGSSTVTIDAEMPYPVMLTGYAFASPQGVDKWKLTASKDGQTYVNLEGGLSSSEGSYNSYVLNLDRENPTDYAYKYFRLVASADDNVEIGEWQLFGSPCVSAERNLPEDMFNGDKSHFEANDPGISGWPEEAFNVLDGMLKTKFTSGDVIKAPSASAPIELTYEISGTAYSYSLTSVWNLPERNPSSWELLGYYGDDWVVLDSRSGITFPTVSSTLVFNIAEPKNCEGYMLRITKNNGSNDNTHLCAWQLFDKAWDIATDVVAAEKVSTSATVYGTAGRIVIDSAEKGAYRVFTITGQTVNSGVAEGKAEISVPAGIYIVVVNDKATKVLVK